LRQSILARPVAGMSAAVPAMHEQMQEGTQEEQHVRQGAEDMRPVLGHQEKRRNGEKGE
jgi:hypothetical protein